MSNKNDANKKILKEEKRKNVLFLNYINDKNRKKILKILLFLFIIIFISTNKKILQYIKVKILNIVPEHKYKYFSCFCGIARRENLYARELIEHYIELGVEKFYLGDHNLINTEKLIDVLKDFVDKGNVEIIDLIGKPKYNKRQTDFYGYVYGKHKSECNWMLFFDFDEFLYFTNKNITTIKQFLSDKKYDKCDVVKINWLIYGDNDLVFYDDRPVKERFIKPDYENPQNRFIKSIVRGNIMEPIWSINGNSHTPNRRKSVCNSLGEKHKKYIQSFIIPPNHSISYIRHYRTKTIEEFAYKCLRGPPEGKVDYQEKLKFFFLYNKYKKEKLELYKKILNINDVDYH